MHFLLHPYDDNAYDVIGYALNRSNTCIMECIILIADAFLEFTYVRWIVKAAVMRLGANP